MTKFHSSETAIVVGGGLVGLACAINLQAQGFKTCLVDPTQEPRPASWGNAGHIAVEQTEPLASAATIKSFPRRLFWRGGALGLPLRDIGAWLPFSLRLLAASLPKRFAIGKAALKATLAEAVPAWQRLLASAGASDLFVEDGHYIVWETEASAAKGRASWTSADTGTATVRDATEAELEAIAALTGKRPAGAIRFLGSGQILDLGQLAETLERRFEELGGQRLRGSVQSLHRMGASLSVVMSDGELLEADTVVVAAGVSSGDLLRPLGYKVPIIAERGYHIQTSNTSWPEGMPPVVFEDRSMIVTRFRSGLRAASFVEFGRLESPADPRKWARLKSHVKALGLSFGEPVSQWMGARPTLPDYLPAIGRAEDVPGLYYAFGHQHLGLTLAAVTGEAIGALVTGETPVINIAPFSLERFRK
ncbi:NAD(P)/FAD-dependent oxidoreductase [Pedomonas mirosovicensis]|uniref:NAD(P)/FAD-dependent oxidoreductase n=1 Tax=Pedomonas mirosovicensis TaxID=2908641 RepID=UPI002168E70C|nr:FAD-binding oxidoreductase [Pedomonas mirosovicensis]MCH8686576.1 FAD-binding oxidoreductase [Pedomonas mirosovicensis]